MTNLSWKFACLITAVLCLFCSYAIAQGQVQHRSNNPSAEFLDMLQERGLAPKVLMEDTKPDLSNVPKDSAIGATVERLYGEKAGLPRDVLPGVQFISSKEARGMDIAETRTGLFLVDVDFVPRELRKALKAFKYTLLKDGTLLDRNQDPILAFMTSEVYLMSREAKRSAMSRALDSVLSVFGEKAHAANPFPWRCYSFSPWAVYHGGFHRWYDARTWADTYGADAAGGCSWGSPHTRVGYISTWAAVGGGGDFDHCFNCESEYSRDTWDVGYFWPAHGIGTTSHFAVYADGTFSFSRSANMGW